jgi:hypothetical protein
MSRDVEMDVLAARLLQYADSPLLERHRDMQDDLLAAARVVRDHAAVLRAREARQADAAKRSY